MGRICWDFPLLGTASLSGSNNAAITMFKGTGIMDGLAREVCQNSLDARDSDLPETEAVRVQFKLTYLERNKFSVFEDYRKALDGAVAYWSNNPLYTDKIRDFLANAKKAIDTEHIPVLTMSDYNTTGLNGVNAKENQRSYWNLLVNTEGISIKQNESSAGSYGIGKNAPFAYSALNMVFYNTLAKDGGRAFEGVTHLVTTQREYNGTMRPTLPSGKYLYLEDEYTGRPILPEDGCELTRLDEFNRTQTGTDVSVVGFNITEYPEWEKNTAIAVLKNFILALLDGKLEVSVVSETRSYEIKKDTIEKLLFNDFQDSSQLKYTRQIYETVTKSKEIKTQIAEKNDLSIYVRYDDGYLASLSRFRSTGMLINTTLESLPHYSVVVVVNDVGNMQLSKTLREAEPPQHNEWKAKNITGNRELHNLAARYIRNITKEVQKVLDEFEKTEIVDKIDSGVGKYLPDASDAGVSSEGTDGLKTDIKINEISSYDGRTFYNSQYESASSNQGGMVGKSGTKAGKRKRKKRLQSKILVVTPSGKGNTGVAPGTGKVKILSLNLPEHRTFYLGANKYRLYVNSPKDYDIVYVRYFAGRDDGNQDAIAIKSFKAEGKPRVDVGAYQMGPISMTQGKNVVYIEFENSEIMAVMPVFTMEVSNEK